MDKIFIVIYDLQVSFFVSNYKFAFLKERKNTSKTIFILVLANKKVFSENQIFSKLSWSNKFTIAIL